MDFLNKHISFQQVSSLEELAAQIHGEQKNLLAFSQKPLQEHDIMATVSLLKQKINLFMPLSTSKDLISNLKLQLDSRHDKKEDVEMK